MTAYLTKPIRRQPLYECLATLLGAPSSSPLTSRQPASLFLAPEAPEEIPARSRVRVLVAEDNPVNQRVAMRMLQKLGYRVDVVADGAEALEALGRIPYDAILMDCMMPEMDGFSATREIRKREASEKRDTLDASRGARHVAIIAMTANAMKGDREMCLEAGMDDYLSKPVKSKELDEILQRWVASESPAGERAAADTGVG